MAEKNQQQKENWSKFEAKGNSRFGQNVRSKKKKYYKSSWNPIHNQFLNGWMFGDFQPFPMQRFGIIIPIDSQPTNYNYYKQMAVSGTKAWGVAPRSLTSLTVTAWVTNLLRDVEGTKGTTR